MKQSCRDCLPEQWCGLSCPVLRQEAEEGASFLAPPSSGFQDDEATAAATGELWIDPLFVAASVVQCCPCISAMAMSGLALPGERGDRGFGHWVCSSLLPGCWWSPWPRPHGKCELLLVQVARRDCARAPTVHKLIDGRQVCQECDGIDKSWWTGGGANGVSEA